MEFADLLLDIADMPNVDLIDSGFSSERLDDNIGEPI